MGEFHVIGKSTLGGSLRIGGSKNAILPILAATVLNNGVSIIHDFPRISDTFAAIEILRSIGCKISYSDNTVVVDSSSADDFCVPERLVHKMRSSIIFLGGILGRLGRVVISYPGGCELGERPIDMHLKALRAMGASIVEEYGFIICEAAELKGAQISLDFPSVGATENIMIAATLAKGTTVIKNAAREPEIWDLQNFLTSMGAKIHGAGSSTIVIEGVSSLDNVEHRIIPDRIITGTYLAAAAITRSEIVLENIVEEHISPITARLIESGCEFSYSGDQVKISSPKRLKAIDLVRTMPHPGFPTDMQPQLMALLSVADGTSIIEETVFESRYKHVAELKRMGADIISADAHLSVIKGVSELMGATVHATDLRAGAALIIAGLAADGETTVLHSEHIERGYEDISGDLQLLGANTKFISGSANHY